MENLFKNVRVQWLLALVAFSVLIVWAFLKLA